MKVQCLTILSLLVAVACGGTGHERSLEAFRLPQPVPESAFVERASEYLREVGHDPACFQAEYHHTTPAEPEWAKLGWELEYPTANVEFTPRDCEDEYPMRVSVFVKRTLDEAEWIVDLKQLTDVQADVIEKAISAARARWPTLPSAAEIIPSVEESTDAYVVTLREAADWIQGRVLLDGDRTVVVDKETGAATPWQFGDPGP